MTGRGAATLVVLGLVASACGGEAFTAGGGTADGGAGSSTAGSGGGAGAGSGGASPGGSGGTGPGGSGGTGTPDAGTGGQAGADAGACPAALPRSSQACSQEGLSCAYGKCCPTHAICSGGSWQIAVTDCAVPGCPSTVPTQGATCTCVNTPLPCHYDCAANMKSTDATCVNDVWSVQTMACAAVPCGGSMCMPGEICLKKSSGAAFTYQCTGNPCGASALSCTCAASLCPQNYSCSASGTSLTCCTNCI